MPVINKKALKYLAELGRLNLKEKDEEKLIKDLEKIFDYFDELREVDTENVEPLDGGTNNKDVMSLDDEAARRSDFNKRRLLDAFPEREGDFLKIPPVFE